MTTTNTFFAFGFVVQAPLDLFNDLPSALPMAYIATTDGDASFIDQLKQADDELALHC
jgi:hypothetical protein